MQRRIRVTTAASLCLLLIGAACSGDDDETHGTREDRPTTSTPVATAHAAGHLVETFVDNRRPTPRSGDEPEQPTRTLETDVYYPAIGDPNGPAIADAEPDAAEGPYPVVVFSHGLGASPDLYADLLTEWARSGFVVVAPAFPLSRTDAPAGPDAGDVQNQPGDISFLIDTVAAAVEAGDGVLAAVADPERIGAAGHSNGAITTLGLIGHSCCSDDRVDAAIVFAGTPAPFAGGDYDLADTPPVLFVHGTADALVAYEEAVRAFNEVEEAKGLLALDGADHGEYVSAQNEFFELVATVTTDFWRTHLLEDVGSRDRLVAAARNEELTYAAEAGSGVTVPTSAPGDIDREAHAEPTTGLVNGDKVTVTWSGFLPGRVVNVVQCSQGGTGGAATCDLTKGQILVPNPTGEGSVELEIVAGPVGTGVCDARSDDCVIAVNDAGLQDEDATIRIPISFAP